MLKYNFNFGEKDMNYREKIKIAKKFVEDQQERINRNIGNYNYDKTDDIRKEAIDITTHLLKIIGCLEYLGDIGEKNKDE